MSSMRSAQKSRKERDMISIAEHLSQVQDYNFHSAIIKDGEMTVQLHGHYIPVKEFNQLVKRPLVPDFKSNKNNVDRTGAWMLD